MSEDFNEIQSRRQWEEAIKAFDVIFLPLKYRALAGFIEKVCDYLDEQKFDPSTIVRVVCTSYLDPGNPEAEGLNEDTLNAMKQVISSYENSAEVEE